MNRRQFLGAVSMLGSCGLSAACTAFATQSADSTTLQIDGACGPDAGYSNNIGIVAIGNAGNQILNRLNATLPQLYRCFAVEGGQLTAIKIDENKRIVPGSPWWNTKTVSRGGVEATVDQITQSIAGVTQLFALTDMSSSVELEVTSVLAEIANKANILMIGAVSNYCSHPKAYGRPRLQDGIARLRQLGIPAISLSGRRCCSQPMWVGEQIPEQLEAAATFERLYRSTALTQDKGHSLVSLDREAVREVFFQKEVAGMVLGYGSANGPDGALLAAYRAVSHPLFDADRERSDIAVLVSIEAGPEHLKLREVNRVLQVIREACPYCIQIVGVHRDPLLKGDVHVTVIAPEAACKNA